MRGVVVAALLGVALAVIVTPTVGVATAQPDLDLLPVIVKTSKPTLVPADGGGWSADVALTNLTVQYLRLNSQPGDLSDRDCTPTLPGMLPAGEATELTVRFDAACDLSGRTLEFEIDAETAAGDTVASIRFAARLDQESEEVSGGDVPDWVIWAVLGAAVMGLIAGPLRHRRTS